MSLIGVKIYITDSATALSCKLRVTLYRTMGISQGLPVESLKAAVQQMILSIDVWWASRPYLKITIDKHQEQEFLKTFKGLRYVTKAKEGSWFLVDICRFSGENLSRFSRAVDLDCSLEGAYVVDDCFEKGMMLMDA